MKAQLLTALMAVILVGCSKPMETPTPASAFAPAPVPARNNFSDAVSTAQHPESENRVEDLLERADSRVFETSLGGFADRYSAAGSPKVTILFNRTFSAQLTSWTMESKQVFQDIHSSTDVGVVGDNFQQAGLANAEVEVSRSESYQEFASVAERQGLSSEYVEWKFREGFTAPFFAAGVNLVDSDLVVQSATRTENLNADNQRIGDINANLTALKEKTDWIVEVLLVPDSRASAGYLFRADVKELESGTILASVITQPDDLRDRPVRRRIIAAPGGYRVVEEKLPVPTLEEYAEDLSIRLLAELNRRLSVAE